MKPPATHRLRLLALAALFQLLFTSGDYAEVYICNGPQSLRYHYSSQCRGLTRCSTKIYKVSMQEARDLGRTLCGWED